MGSSDDDMNKRKAEAAPNKRDKEEQWDAARLKGWHGMGRPHCGRPARTRW